MIASLTDQETPARVYPYGAPHTAEMIADLSRRAYEYRVQVLRMVYGSKSGHIGGAFSIAEILTCLYFHQLRIDPANPKWEDRDRLVFSKGHACAMLYTCLAHRGFLDRKRVSPASTFISFGSIPPIPNGKIETASSFQRDMPAPCSTRALRIAGSFRLTNCPPDR